VSDGKVWQQQLTVGVDVVEKDATLGVAIADDDADSVGETLTL
jgi:hypothetical protein